MLIIDDFLTEEDFDIVFTAFNYFDFKFYTQANLNSNNEHHFHFIHFHIDDWVVSYENADYIPRIIMNTYSKYSKKNVSLIRARSNLFVKTLDHPTGMGYHQDIPNSIAYPNLHTLLMYLEDSNGSTEFKDGINVISKRNRAVVFHNDSFHQTMTSTDTLFRRNININFIED